MAPSSSFIPGSQARAFVAKAIKANPTQRFPKRFFYGVMLFVSQREPHPAHRRVLLTGGIGGWNP